MPPVTRPLLVGLIRVGPTWRRYARALRAMPERFRIAAVHDPVFAQACQAAQRLNCLAAESVAQLLEQPKLDAVLLLDRPWHGHWAAERALAAGKAVFSVPYPADEPAHLDSLKVQIEKVQAPLMFARPLLHTPATIRLRRLLRMRLGPALQMDCATTEPLATVLDWWSELCGASTVDVRRLSERVVLADCGEGRIAHVTLHESNAERRCKFEGGIRTAAGEANFRQPDRLSWRTASVQITERWIRPYRFEARLLRNFHQTVIDPGRLEHARSEALRILQLAQSAASVEA